jgi:hypothetical protein
MDLEKIKQEFETILNELDKLDTEESEYPKGTTKFEFLDKTLSNVNRLGIDTKTLCPEMNSSVFLFFNQE